MTAILEAISTRPRPPAHLFDEDLEGNFAPAPELREWAYDTFVSPSSPLYDDTHQHLEDAHVGFLWTSADWKRRGVPVAGTASIPKPHPALSGWEKSQYLWQLRRWFGTDQLDFLIRIHAGYAIECPDADFCALVKHEFCHCGQARDEYGDRRFTKKENKPIFTLDGHDVETFLAVARDFGPVERNVRELIEIVRRPPRIAAADISRVCGNCLARAA